MTDGYAKHTSVATILANGEDARLDDNEINSVVDAIQASGGIIEDVDWLAQGKACDIFFAVLSIEEVDRILENLLAQVPFDYVVQKAQGRKKKLLISDMDSTMINQECIDEIAAFAGIKDQISKITDRTMNGELDFKDSLRERVGLLKGLSEDVLNEAFEKHISVMSGAKELISTMKENGARCVLVSGGFTFFTSRVAEELGFDVQEANILEIEGGVLTGKVREPILDSSAKLNSLLFHAEDLGIGISDTIVIGDGANDLPMIQHSCEGGGLGVAYHAKPGVQAQAKIKINYCDLSALLYVQGYKS